MAALTDFLAPRITGLDRVSGKDLRPLLDEEVGMWREKLHWDYSPSAELIERFVTMESLAGYALVLGSKPIGYCYQVVDSRKGIIGGLFVAAKYRSVSTEGLLLEAALAELMKTRGVRRIEAQLMALTRPVTREYPRHHWLTNYCRDFMDFSLTDCRDLPVKQIQAPVVIRDWTQRAIDETGGLISRAYGGHIDGRINDLYRSPGGARKFLENIVQFPGCGAFFAPASFVAVDTVTKRQSGVVLASMVASDVGHITQVCVDKAMRGSGLGYELMRRAMTAMAAHGCTRVSLTVTSSNDEAVQLYQRMGFAKRAEFVASIWDGF